MCSTTTTTSPYPVLLQKPITANIEATDNSMSAISPTIIISSSVSNSVSSVKGGNSNSSGSKKKRVTGTPLFSNASVRSYKS